MEQLELFDGSQYEVPTPPPLEPTEIVVVEYEYDDRGNITKETTTVTKPRLANPKQPSWTPYSTPKIPWNFNTPYNVS